MLKLYGGGPLDNQKSIIENVARLVKQRGWEKYHRPRFLVNALIVEASELMNCCLWLSPEEIDDMFLRKDEEVVKELADIAINFFQL